MSYFASLRRPLGIAAVLTASVAIVACNPTRTPNPAPKAATVTGVTVTPATATLAVKATVKATATVQGANNPAQAVTWTTSNASVATVTSTGLITAVAAGEATVTAKSTVSGYTDRAGSVKVTVTPSGTVSEVELVLTPDTVAVGGTATARATVTGTNNSQNVQYSSSNPGVATVDDDGKITAKAVGTTVITVAASDDLTKKASATLTVTAAGSGTRTTAKINFQQAGVATPAGYTPNTGEAYNASTMTGWVTETTAGTAAPLALDLTGNGRSRNVDGTNVVAGLDARLYTQIQMQCGTPTFGNPCNAPASNTSGAFEYKVVNGKYNVTVSVGDADMRNLNSSHTVNVEGVNAINAFVPTASDLFKKNTVVVTVSDGRLTIDAKGGQNTKLNYLDITPSN